MVSRTRAGQRPATLIGLDIGSSAVRAAELGFRRGKATIQRYGQVGLPPGVVSDGEVVNEDTVVAALRRLWAEAGFTSRKVVIGASGSRVIVRQADVPALDEEDLRSALKFNALDLIPIPIEEACFDFAVIDRSPVRGNDGKSTMRVLITAAHRSLIETHLRVLAAAHLTPVAVSPVSLALLRLTAEASDLGTQAVVAVGSETTTVAVSEGGNPRFIRSVPLGGARLTAELAAALHVDIPVAEAFKRQMGSASTSSPAETAVSRSLDVLADEVQGTIDFFAAQPGAPTVERVLLTGGGSRIHGLDRRLQESLGRSVEMMDPFSLFPVDARQVPADVATAASPAAGTAIGLAMWRSTDPIHRLSVLPTEVLDARRARTVGIRAGFGVGALAVVLAAGTGAQVLQVHDAQRKAAASQEQIRIINAAIDRLTAVTAVHGRVQTQRQIVVSALKGDVDWVRFIGELNKSQPSGLTVTSFTATASAPTSAPAGGVSTGLGQLTIGVQGPGGLPAVAEWLDGVGKDPDLTGIVLSAISQSGNVVTFSATATITDKALSGRAQAVPR